MEHPKKTKGGPKIINGEVVSGGDPNMSPEKKAELEKLKGLFNGGEKKDVVVAPPEEPIAETSGDTGVPEEEVQEIPGKKVKGRKEESGKRVKRLPKKGSEEIAPKEPRKARTSIRMTKIKEPAAMPEVATEIAGTTEEAKKEKQPETVQEIVPEKREESRIEKLKKLDFKTLIARINIYVGNWPRRVDELNDSQIKEELEKMFEMEETANDFLRNRDNFFSRLSDEEIREICYNLESARDGLVNLRRKISKEEKPAPETKEPIIDLAELNPETIWFEVRKLDYGKFAVAINNYISKIEPKLDSLNQLQKEEEKHRIAGIGRVAVNMLDGTDKSTDKDRLGIAEEKLKELYDRISLEDKTEKPADNRAQNEEQNKEQNELDQLNAPELTEEIKKLINQLKDKIGTLSPEQTEEALYKITAIGRAAEDKLLEGDDRKRRNTLTDIGKKVGNELNREVDNLKKLENLLRESIKETTKEASKTEEEKPRRRPVRGGKFSMEEGARAEMPIGDISTWQLETELEDINSKINNLTDALKIATEENDKKEILKVLEGFKKKSIIIGAILAFRTSTSAPASESESESEPKSMESSSTITPIEIEERIKQKKQEIEETETKASIYRPAGGLFRKKPVVRDLGYYGITSDLEKLNKELEELERMKAEIELGPKKEKLEELERTHRIYGPAGWHRKPAVKDLGYYDREEKIAELRSDIKKLGKEKGKDDKEQNNAELEKELKEVVVLPEEKKTKEKRQGFFARIFGFGRKEKKAKEPRILTDEELRRAIGRVKLSKERKAMFDKLERDSKDK